MSDMFAFADSLGPSKIAHLYNPTAMAYRR